MKSMDVFRDNELLIWNLFDTYAENNNYNIIVHNDHHMGRGSLAYKGDDSFKPIITLHLFGIPGINYDFGIIVSDRNGNSILTGETCAVYTLNAPAESEYNELEERFGKILDYVFKKYEPYSKENRLDYVFNGLELERVNF